MDRTGADAMNVWEHARLYGKPKKSKCKRNRWGKRAKAKKFNAPQRKGFCSVYGLRCPKTGDIVYVGQTRCVLFRRLGWHWKNLNACIGHGRGLSPVQRWLREQRAAGLNVEIVLVDDKGIWDASEAVWIDRLTRDGIKLLNVARRVGNGVLD
jgi:hypothetical protein